MTTEHVMAFSWTDPTTAEKEIITNLIQAAWPEASFEIVTVSKNVTRIDSFKHLTADKYVVFGDRSSNYITSYFPTLIKLPKLTDLIDIPENESIRLHTWNLLNTVKNKNYDDLELELNKSDLAGFFKEKLKMIISSGEDIKFVGKTHLGKTVLITTKKQDKTEGYDYCLTFEELYAARFACELFKIDSLVITKGKEK